MKRWNGWGYTTVEQALSADGLAYLEKQLGAGRIQADAAFSDILARVPESRLPEHRLISKDPAERVLHSTGQSLPDWVAMRSGNYPAIADGVAYPCCTEEVRELLDFAREKGIRLIPYGGGTSVVGHLKPDSPDMPVLMLDMQRMNRLLNLDEDSQIATFQAGVKGPELEAALRCRGYTLGHYPQSFEFSTLGGWIATRSSGQQSRYYGRVEQFFLGGHVETPMGSLELPTFPASAAGSDIRDIVLGSEGRLGIITEASIRISPLPEHECFQGIFFPSFEQGLQAVRAMSQANLPLSMMRLSNALETETNLRLAHHWAIPHLETYLKLRGIKDGKSLLIYGLTGRNSICRMTKREVMAIARQYGGLSMGKMLGNAWAKNRFRGAYLRNTLWDLGYAVDTVETATPWANAIPMMQAVEAGIRDASKERVLVFSHLSHVYSTGTSVYTTYAFPLGKTPEETLANWQATKAAASKAIMANHGTISHQHGVGADHAPYLEEEKGELALAAIDSAIREFDPQGVMRGNDAK